MAHDFAKKKTPKGNTKGKPAHIRNSNQAPEAAWGWLITGFLSGLFVSFVLYFSLQKLQLLPVYSNGIAQADSPATQPVEQKTPNGSDQIQYDFYNLLKEGEIVVDELFSTSPSEDEQEIEKSANYLWQAGSFPKLSDADSLRATLILNGLNSQIVPATVEGQSWYRVQVGPFNNDTDIRAARNTLTSMNIYPIKLKAK